MLKFRQVMPEEWEMLPVPKAKKVPDEWNTVLTALKDGQIVELETSSEKDLRGKRIGLSRRARGRGFTVEYRTKDNLLYAKRGPAMNKAAGTSASGTGTKKRGRPRKDTTASAVAPVPVEEAK